MGGDERLRSRAACSPRVGPTLYKYLVTRQFRLCRCYDLSHVLCLVSLLFVLTFQNVKALVSSQGYTKTSRGPDWPPGHFASFCSTCVGDYLGT